MSIVEFDQKNSIGYITLNRPEKRNALSYDGLVKLDNIIHEVCDDPQVKVIIIKGNGKDFCAGHDLTEICSTERCIHHYREMFSRSATMMMTLHSLRQPVIAQVQGVATAAGCQLVAACDLAVAERGALFSTPGVKIGLFCSTPMVPLCRAVGRKQALEMLFTGENISAEKALRIGLINRVVEKEVLEEETVHLAERIAQYSGDVLAIGKRAFYHQIDQLESVAYDVSKEVISLNCLHEDAHEGILAMLEKRRPMWKHRKNENE